MQSKIYKLNEIKKLTIYSILINITTPYTDSVLLTKPFSNTINCNSNYEKIISSTQSNIKKQNRSLIRSDKIIVFERSNNNALIMIENHVFAFEENMLYAFVIGIQRFKQKYKWNTIFP